MSTKSNSKLTYPCIVNIAKAMGKKRKDPVIRALNYIPNAEGEIEDLSKAIVYPTLRNAYVAGYDLIKETIDSKWQRISKADAKIALKAIADTGKLPEKPVKAVVVKPTKVAKPAKVAKAIEQPAEAQVTDQPIEA